MARLSHFEKTFLITTRFSASLPAENSDMTEHTVPSSQMCFVCRSTDSIRDHPSDNTPSPSILHFINVTLRDLVQLRQDETTLTND